MTAARHVDAEVMARYRSLAVPSVGYSTVRDFSDSLQHLHELATRQGDLKDAQRPWIVKALWSLVPVGSRILEIGAGQPYVADFLQRLGYDVTIVDPYDGSGNGPIEYEKYREQYPLLRIIRHRFEANADEIVPGHDFDAIFSISVLEHLSSDELVGVAVGARELLHGSGWSIHNVDHVLEGWGGAISLQRLEVLARLHGVSGQALGDELRRAQRDPETYFLSAESHERWRAYLGLSYDDYPMQRVISIGVAARRDALPAAG